MPGETIWCHSVHILANQLFHGEYYSCHEFILEWLFVHSHSWTQTLWIKQGVSDLHWPWIHTWHDVSPYFSYVKAGRQQMWVRQQEFCLGCSCSTFDGAEQFFIAEIYCFNRKFTLWLLCGCSCKYFWSATFVMIL